MARATNERFRAEGCPLPSYHSSKRTFAATLRAPVVLETVVLRMELSADSLPADSITCTQLLFEVSYLASQPLPHRRMLS